MDDEAAPDIHRAMPGAPALAQKDASKPEPEPAQQLWPLRNEKGYLRQKGKKDRQAVLSLKDNVKPLQSDNKFLERIKNDCKNAAAKI